MGEVVARSGVDPSTYDDVLRGEAVYGGGDVARRDAAIEAGMDDVPGA